MKALYMIRHSLTEGNLRRLYYGSTDLPLAPEGHELCRRLRGSFELPEDISFAATPYVRTQETLRGLFGDVPFEIFDDMREMSMGKFEMKSYDDLKNDPDYQAWLDDRSGQTVIPGGESNLSFAKRVTGCICKMAREREGSMFIVCHGGTIASAMFSFFTDERESFYDWTVHACEGFVIFFENGEPSSWKAI